MVPHGRDQHALQLLYFLHADPLGDPVNAVRGGAVNHGGSIAV